MDPGGLRELDVLAQRAPVTAIRQLVVLTFENPEARYLEGAPARRKAALLARSVDDLGDLLFGQVPLVNSDDDS